MASTIILSDNGASSGSAGLKQTAGNDGVLILQTTTSGGTATNAIYVDTSQNVGVGVTPSAWSGFTALQIQNGALFTDSTSFRSIMNGYYNGSNWIYSTTNAATRYEQVNGIHRWYNAASGTAGNTISFTQAMTLDASGNLLVGVTSASYSSANRGVINVGGSSGGLLALSSSTNKSYLLQSGADLLIENDTASGNLIFGTGSSTERARIDSSGNLLVGSTSNTSSAAKLRVYQSDTGNPSFTSEKTTTAVSNHVLWYNPNGAVGAIGTNGSTTYYNTSSDYRLKENVQPMTGALNKVAQLKPVTYTWKSDGTDGQGFIAHELQEVVPDCVHGEKDAVDADGNPVYQGIDTSFLVATLTAAIQELKAELDTAKEQIAILQGAQQ